MKLSRIVILLAELVLFGWLVYRHRQRPAGRTVRIVPRTANDLKPEDVMQANLIIVLPGNLDWREKIRREEQAQRPQEGRN